MRFVRDPDLFEPPDAGLVQAMEVIRAARWAGVAPWELAAQSAWWLDMILLTIDAEATVIKRAVKNGD